MWSDPEDIEAWQVSPRGAGWLFGYRVTNEFNRINRLDLIARSHQLVQEGYKYFFPDENLVTVWSAPNYCYRCGNVASILSLDDKLNRDFKIFSAVSDDKRVIPARTTLPYFFKFKPFLVLFFNVLTLSYSVIPLRKDKNQEIPQLLEL